MSIKKIIAILFAFTFSISVIGQNIPIDTTTYYEKYLLTGSLDTAKMLLNDLVKTSKRNFNYIGAALPVSVHDLYTVLGYVSDEDGGDDDAMYQFFLQRTGKFDRNNYKSKIALLFNYTVYMVGENKDLEIKGKPLYVFSSVRGKFLDIFPIWKKYFNPNAIQDTVIEKQADYFLYHRKNGKYSQFVLSKKAHGWELEMRLYATKPEN